MEKIRRPVHDRPFFGCLEKVGSNFSQYEKQDVLGNKKGYSPGHLPFMKVSIHVNNNTDKEFMSLIVSSFQEIYLEFCLKNHHQSLLATSSK
ncbi:unnamed protein product [Dovyalis caffra]|uniref:Uncharacterized protein n=1 Tax=Dovyalis caffra TaxID=77055 RepID=A0AAV1S1P2_9ROSI|nr:unnamed protein product [Dovyalis caffra]